MKNYKAEQEARSEEIAKKRAAKEAELKEPYRALFKTDLGISVLKQLAKYAQFGEDSFASSPDDRTNAYIQGRQSVLIHIKKILED
jgi:hypothetical protein